MDMLPALAVLALVAVHPARYGASAAATTTPCRDIYVDASSSIGTLKNLQATNNGNTNIGGDTLDNIHDEFQAIGSLYPSYGIKHVLIYNWPDVFTGYGKPGAAGDATSNANYNWTQADAYIRFVTSNGAKASIQFNPANGVNTTLSSPSIIGDIGYMITDRYMHGAHGSGFSDALELFDFYAESDGFNSPSIYTDYATMFSFFSGFAKGVARAASSAGVGAWGGNRAWVVRTNYSLPDPYITQFYKDCKTNGIPIKAATFHFTNSQYSLDPYDIRRVVDALRANVLAPAGFPNLPIWATEFEVNPGAVDPITPQARADYNSPAFFASYLLGTTMYAQDTSIDQTFLWTGFGYGGFGAGNAYFPAFFNKTATNPTVPLNAAYAWKLQNQLISATPQRLRLDGTSADGFTALAGASAARDEVQVLLNNYQLNYDIVREIAAGTAPSINASTAAYPLIQPSGLLNGEQACFNTGNPIVYVPVCLAFPQPTIRNNTSTAYKIRITNLPWLENTSYNITIQRVGGTETYQIYRSATAVGSSFETKLPFPANAQDLITLRRV